MKYYVVLTVVFNDGTNDKVGIYNFETEQKAIKNFYKYMSQYVDENNVQSVNVEAKNSVGGVYKNEAWVRKEVEGE